MKESVIQLQGYNLHQITKKKFRCTPMPQVGYEPTVRVFDC
jgi:hypothetical protein